MTLGDEKDVGYVFESEIVEEGVSFFFMFVFFLIKSME